MFLDSIYNSLCSKIRNLPLIRRYPTLKELIKYSIVGNFSNLVDFSLYFYLTRVFSFWREHYLIANLFTLFIASIIRFIFHKRWTFRDSGTNVHIQYLKLICLLIAGLIINEAVLFISVEHFILNDLIGKLIAIILGTLVIYYFTRTWVFSKPPQS